MYHRAPQTFTTMPACHSGGNKDGRSRLRWTKFFGLSLASSWRMVEFNFICKKSENFHENVWKRSRCVPQLLNRTNYFKENSGRNEGGCRTSTSLNFIQTLSKCHGWHCMQSNIKTSNAFLKVPAVVRNSNWHCNVSNAICGRRPLTNGAEHFSEHF